MIFPRREAPLRLPPRDAEVPPTRNGSYCAAIVRPTRGRCRLGRALRPCPLRIFAQMWRGFCSKIVVVLPRRLLNPDGCSLPRRLVNRSICCAKPNICAKMLRGRGSGLRPFAAFVPARPGTWSGLRPAGRWFAARPPGPPFLRSGADVACSCSLCDRAGGTASAWPPLGGWSVFWWVGVGPRLRRAPRLPRSPARASAPPAPLLRLCGPPFVARPPLWFPRSIRR